MHYRRFGRTGWTVSEIGYGMWGLAGWTGGRRRDGQGTRTLGRARLQLLRHRLGLWRRQERADPRPVARETLRQRALRGDQDPAQEPHVALAPGVHARRLLPPRPHPRIHREEPGEPGRLHDRPAAVPRLGRRLGQRRALAARGGRPQAPGPGPGLRRERQPVGAGQRARDAEDRPDRLPSRSSTTSSTRRPRTSCSPSAASWTSPSSPAFRSTRAR